MTNLEKNQIELGMLNAALTRAICYNDRDEMIEINNLIRDWNDANDEGKRAIYHAYRNKDYVKDSTQC